jgi:DNA-binding LacI/PurR family transcriptional regulator
MNKKNITITDVATEAKVSIATVSRVLNNPEKVKQDTIDKVNEAIRQLKYDSASLKLKSDTKDTQLVTIFMPTIFSESLSEIARGAQEELEKNGVDSVIWNANENAQNEVKGISNLLKYNMDGAIFISSCVEDFSLEEIASHIPSTAVERTVRQETEIDAISVDAEQGITLLVDYLYDLGHRKFGLLCGDIGSSMVSIRSRAFKKALTLKGLQWDPSCVISSGWTVGSGFQGTEQLLNYHKDITALVCISDVMALGALSAVQHLGLSCPQDISIVGLDNMPSSEFLYPRLTTLSYPGYHMGQLAARSILDRFQGLEQPRTTTLLPMQIIVRESAGKAK